MEKDIGIEPFILVLVKMALASTLEVTLVRYWAKILASYLIRLKKDTKANYSKVSAKFDLLVKIVQRKNLSFEEIWD